MIGYCKGSCGTSACVRAAGYAAEDRAKVERLKAGEDINVGKPLDFVEIFKKAGWTAADMRNLPR